MRCPRRRSWERLIRSHIRPGPRLARAGGLVSRNLPTAGILLIALTEGREAGGLSGLRIEQVTTVPSPSKLEDVSMSVRVGGLLVMTGLSIALPLRVARCRRRGLRERVRRHRGGGRNGNPCCWKRARSLMAPRIRSIPRAATSPLECRSTRWEHEMDKQACRCPWSNEAAPVRIATVDRWFLRRGFDGDARGA
jgi:hypothetical protein